MAAGGVGGLRHVKTAIAAARLVMERSTHTLLVGLRASQVWVLCWALLVGCLMHHVSSDGGGGPPMRTST